MTVGVMASCSPAQWGMPCNGLCRARTGAPHGGNPNPPPQRQGPQGHVEYWKAQCGESRTLRLGGGKGRRLFWGGGKGQTPLLSLINGFYFFRGKMKKIS